MSWIFGSIDFEAYGVYVSKSEGVLNMPTLVTEGTNWLDADGLQYWQGSGDMRYNDRTISLKCFIAAAPTETDGGYEVFLAKVQAFFDAILNEGWADFVTPYGTIETCRIKDGVTVTREKSYLYDEQIGTFDLNIHVKEDINYQYYNVIDWKTFLTKYTIRTDNLVVNRMLQGESYATCSFEVKDKPTFHIWDYVMINTNGVRAEPYYFLHEPDIKKISTNKYAVTVRLDHGSILLKQATFLNSNYEADFYMYANLDEILDLIIDGGNRFVGLTKFTKGEIAPTNNKLHKFTCENCYDLLKRLASEYELEYDIRWPASGSTYIIDIKQKIGRDTAITLEYGKNNAMYEISRGTPNRNELVTCLYAYGSNKNLPMDYRGGKDRLEFDGNPLKLNDDDNMPIELSKTWDDIFPRRQAKVGGYYYKAKVDLTNKEKQNFPNGIFRIEDKSINFRLDLDSDNGGVLQGGTTPKVSMLDGPCAGLTFDIKLYDHENFWIYLIQYEDEAGNKYPNPTHPIVAGNLYTLTDIVLPKVYRDEAELELKAAATAFIQEYSVLKYPYTAILHPKYTDALSSKPEVGDRVTVIDGDLGLNEYRRIAELKYEAGKRIYTLHLSEHRQLTYRDRVKVLLDEFKRTQSATDQANAQTMRTNQETTKELKNRLFDPVDELLDADKIVRNESIDPRMLAFDAGVPQWYLQGCIVYTPWMNETDRVYVSQGKIIVSNWPDNVLTRYKISLDRPNYLPIREWNMAAIDFTLPTADVYYLHAKLPLEAGATNGTFHFETLHREVKYFIEDNYLYYRMGTIYVSGSPRLAEMLWGNVGYLPEAPVDGRLYLRKDKTWVTLDLKALAKTHIYGSSEVVATLRVQGGMAVEINGSSEVTGFIKDINALISTISGSSEVVAALHSATAVKVEVIINGGSVVVGTLIPKYGGGIAEVITDLSVTGDGTADAPITLVNDEESPGTSKYYGTDSGGTKGFHDLPAGGGGGGFSIVDETTGSFTASATHKGNYTRVNYASGVNVTMPADTFSPGDVFCFEHTGNGAVTIVADSGVTCNGYDGLTSYGQYAVLTVVCVASNVFTVIAGTGF